MSSTEPVERYGDDPSDLVARLTWLKDQVQCTRPGREVVYAEFDAAIALAELVLEVNESMRRDLANASVYVVAEECGYDVGRVVRGVYATPDAAMRAHPGEWKPGATIDCEPDSWSAGLRDIDRYEVQT